MQLRWKLKRLKKLYRIDKQSDCVFIQTHISFSRVLTKANITVVARSEEAAQNFLDVLTAIVLEHVEQEARKRKKVEK